MYFSVNPIFAKLFVIAHVPNVGMSHESNSMPNSGSPGSLMEDKDRQFDGKPESNYQVPGEEEDTSGHLHGWRLWVVAILISIVYFIVQVEISIVTTSIVNITQDIGGFARAGWVMSAYLLGFVSKSHFVLFPIMLSLLWANRVTFSQASL